MDILFYISEHKVILLLQAVSGCISIISIKIKMLHLSSVSTAWLHRAPTPPGAHLPLSSPSQSSTTRVWGSFEIFLVFLCLRGSHELIWALSSKQPPIPRAQSHAPELGELRAQELKVGGRGERSGGVTAQNLQCSVHFSLWHCINTEPDKWNPNISGVSSPGCKGKSAWIVCLFSKGDQHNNNVILMNNHCCFFNHFSCSAHPCNIYWFKAV